MCLDRYTYHYHTNARYDSFGNKFTNIFTSATNRPFRTPNEFLGKDPQTCRGDFNATQFRNKVSLDNQINPTKKAAIKYYIEQNKI